MNQWLLRLIGLIVGSASPELRAMLTEWVNRLEDAAKATPNPFDDVLVGLLKIVLNINGENPPES